MMPNIDSLVDELLLIKLAEEDGRKPWRFPSAGQWKQLGKGALVYGAGAGLGTGLGYALKRKVLSKLLPQMGNKALTALSYGSGALLGLGGAASLRQLMKGIEERREQR